MKFIKFGVILFAISLSGIILMKIANAGWLSGVFLQNGMPATSDMHAWQADVIWKLELSEQYPKPRCEKQQEYVCLVLLAGRRVWSRWARVPNANYAGRAARNNSI